MRHINNALQIIIVLVFWLAIGAAVSTGLALAFVGSEVDGFRGFLAGTGMGVFIIVFALIGLLFAFSLICPLLEIAENTRVLRDAVESGDLRLTQSGQNKLPPQ